MYINCKSIARSCMHAWSSRNESVLVFQIHHKKCKVINKKFFYLTVVYNTIHILVKHIFHFLYVNSCMQACNI